jgi:hypothetical protein
MDTFVCKDCGYKINVPLTIGDVNIFMRHLPFGYDGFLHWEYINKAFPRTITGSDIDLATDIESRFRDAATMLTFETTDSASKFNRNERGDESGQMRMFDRLIRRGFHHHFDIVGKEIPTRWRHRCLASDGSVYSTGWRSSADERVAIANEVKLIARKADGLTKDKFDFGILKNTWAISSASTRKRFAEFIKENFDYRPPKEPAPSTANEAIRNDKVFEYVTGKDEQPSPPPPLAPPPLPPDDNRNLLSFLDV